MAKRIAHIGHNEQGEIVVNFDPNTPGTAYHVVFTLLEAQTFANTMLKRVKQVAREKAAKLLAEDLTHN